MHKKSGFPLLAAGLLGLTVLGVAPASASQPAAASGMQRTAAQAPAQCVPLASYAGATCWQARGDVMTVSDDAADGHHVSAVWRTDYGRTGRCSNFKGAGSKRTCNYDVGEKATITIKTQLREGSKVLDESGPRSFPAG